MQVSTVLLLAIAAFLNSGVAHASQRVALVIGNSDYLSQPLANPRNDAEDMAAQLNMLGYEVYSGGALFDLDRISMERTLRSFAQSLPESATALFYYAGHGMVSDNDNYLIPINHRLEFQEQLPDRAVSLRSAVELLKHANPDGVNIVLLDACRDNPLTRNFRTTRQGLVKLTDIPRGIFIGYASDIGQVAEDGKGRNGIYTKAILEVMKEQPDVIIEVAHKNIARRVFSATDGKQFPVSENKVFGDWCFGNCGSPSISTELVNAVNTPMNTLSSAPVPDNGSMNWKRIGAIVMGVLVVGAIVQHDSSKPEESDFQLVLRPPQ